MHAINTLIAAQNSLVDFLTPTNPKPWMYTHSCTFLVASVKNMSVDQSVLMMMQDRICRVDHETRKRINMV